MKLDFGQKLTIGIILVLTVPILIAAVAQADTEYKPLTPAAQETYDSARLTLCKSEKVLAGAKLMDAANNVKIEGDLNELATKRDMDCSNLK